MSTFTDVCMALFCLGTLSLHVAKKNLSEVALYALQSAMVAALLSVSLWQHWSLDILLIVLVTVAVKVVLAPLFFARLIRRHELKFSARTYANAPETLLAIVLVLFLVNSHLLAPVTHIVPAHHGYLALALSALFASILLMANRRGTLSQAVGVLSLENSILVFAIFAGLEQSPVLELGIIFDIFVWLMIASVFVSMAYKHFGSADVTAMRNLKG